MSEDGNNGNGATTNGVNSPKKKRARKIRSWPRKNWRQRFIKELAISPNVTLAAEKAGVSSNTVYLYKKKEPSFCQQWDRAVAAGYDRLEGLSLHDAAFGTEDWTWLKDGAGRLVKKPLPNKVSVIERIFHLKARFPDRFRENLHTEISGPQGGPIDLSLGVVIQWPHEGGKLNGNGNEPKQIEGVVTPPPNENPP